MRTFYGYAKSPFGNIVIFRCVDGICKLSFYDKPIPDDDGSFLRNDKAAQRCIDKFMKTREAPKLCLLDAKPIQKKVWNALLSIHYGKTVSFQEFAEMVGMPDKSRTVAHIISQNPISLFIPSHRITYKDHRLNGQASGIARKRKILAWEKAEYDIKIKRQRIAQHIQRLNDRLNYEHKEKRIRIIYKKLKKLNENLDELNKKRNKYFLLK